MIDEKRLAELYKRGTYHMGDITEMCQTLEALWRIARAAQKLLAISHGGEWPSELDDLQEALRALTVEAK